VPHYVLGVAVLNLIHEVEPQTRNEVRRSEAPQQ